MLRHEAGSIDGSDIEELHDMRVAVRRMRAAVRLFRPYLPEKHAAYLRRDLRRLGRALGPARDCDVMLANLEAYRAELPTPTQDAFAPLVRRWQRQRERSHNAMVRYLTSKRYRLLKQRIGPLLELVGPPVAASGTLNGQAAAPQEPLVAAVTPRLIAKRYDELLAYGPSLHGASIKTLHTLRIDCKRLRYALEFLRETLSPQAEAAIEDFKHAQDRLGEINDAYVAGEDLRKFMKKWQRATDDARYPAAAREALAGYLAYCDDRVRTNAHTFPAIWEHLTGCEFRQRLRETLSSSAKPQVAPP